MRAVDLLEANFSYLSSAGFILKVGTIADLLAVHPAFQVFPEHVPDPARLRQQMEAFKDAVNASANGDRQKVAERKILRAALEQSTTIIAQHLIMVAIYRNDLTLLQNTGYELKHRNHGKNSDSNVLAAPSQFRVKRGADSGVVIAYANRGPGVASFELQVTEGEPLLDSTWKTLALYATCRMLVKDLEPGKKYTFRVRSLGAAGQSPWSSTVTLIVI